MILRTATMISKQSSHSPQFHKTSVIALLSDYFFPGLTVSANSSFLFWNFLGPNVTRSTNNSPEQVRGQNVMSLYTVICFASSISLFLVASSVPLYIHTCPYCMHWSSSFHTFYFINNINSCMKYLFNFYFYICLHHIRIFFIFLLFIILLYIQHLHLCILL